MQEQDFEQKVAMLRREFPQVNGDQVHHFLETAQGNSDVAYSMLLEDVDNLVQQVCSSTPFCYYSQRVMTQLACMQQSLCAMALVPAVVEVLMMCLSVHMNTPHHPQSFLDTVWL